MAYFTMDSYQKLNLPMLLFFSRSMPDLEKKPPCIMQIISMALDSCFPHIPWYGPVLSDEHCYKIELPIMSRCEHSDIAYHSSELAWNFCVNCICIVQKIQLSNK